MSLFFAQAKDNALDGAGAVDKLVFGLFEIHDFESRCNTLPKCVAPLLLEKPPRFPRCDNFSIHADPMQAAVITAVFHLDTAIYNDFETGINGRFSLLSFPL